MDDEANLNEQIEDIRYRLLGSKDAAYFGAEEIMAHHLKLWPIRFTIGALICGAIAWRWPWGKWLLAAWIAVMSFALCYILYSRRKIRRKFDVLESKLNKTWIDGSE